MKSNLQKHHRQRTGNRSLPPCPADVFPCKDGPVALAAASDEEFQCLCQAMGRPELAENENFAPRFNRSKKVNAAALLEIIRQWVKDKTVAEISRLGAQFGFTAGPVLKPGGIFCDCDAADIARTHFEGGTCVNVECECE